MGPRGRRRGRRGLAQLIRRDLPPLLPLCVSEFGSTLGKRISGVRVAHRDTERNIGFGRAPVREISWPVFSLVPVLGLLNSLWCCWDSPYRQCLHDKLPHTVAVGC
ncbi:RDD family protein [Streptomyces sp. NPDC058794]|uniref:RDD family protein n=1 Tax=unclassified Streptomyces TaxID=2593676 RepID=UPI0036A5972C